jgi:hypothetical protein
LRSGLLLVGRYGSLHRKPQRYDQRLGTITATDDRPGEVVFCASFLNPNDPHTCEMYGRRNGSLWRALGQAVLIYLSIGSCALTAQQNQPGSETFSEMIAFARLASVACDGQGLNAAPRLTFSWLRSPRRCPQQRLRSPRASSACQLQLTHAHPLARFHRTTACQAPHRPMAAMTATGSNATTRQVCSNVRFSPTQANGGNDRYGLERDYPAGLL